MMKTTAQILRGGLKAHTVDARRIMQAAKNPACAVSRTAMLAGIDMEEMVKTAFGAALENQQSPFALRQGVVFERWVSEGGATRLIDALVKKNILGPSEIRVRHLGDNKDLRSGNAAVRDAAIRQAIAETDKELKRKAAGDPKANNVLLQAHVPVRLANDGLTVVLRPDALIARDAAPAYMIGELKSFPALHHNTDTTDVEAAAAQAGVYGVAVEDRMRDLGIAAPLPKNGVLILKAVGSLNADPSLQPIDRDVDFARRMLSQRPRTLAEVTTLLGPGQGLDRAANILKLPRNFIGACRSFCPMAKVCQNLAVSAKHPAAVSNNLSAVIGDMDTGRAIALLNGATPTSADEADVQQRLQTAYAALRRAS
jgi:hypothetical protein